MATNDREDPGRTVTLLHLSDLHASETEDFGQTRVTAAFIEDLRAQSEVTPIDLVVFSGDLAFAGSRAEFQLGYSLLLEPTLRCCGLAPERLVIVPGNHDVDRDQINPFEDLGLRQTLKDEATVTRLLAEPQQLVSAVKRLDAWQSFVEGIPGTASATLHGGLGRAHTYDVRGTSIGVAALNSAWRCGSDQDERTLLIGESQLVSTLGAVLGCDVRLVVAHHPLEWLVHFDESAARRALEGERVLYLCGHEHTSDPSVERRRGAGVVYSRAGCMYESTDYLTLTR